MRIARDVSNLLSVISSLKHQVARFIYDDGRSQLLFQLEGTVEIVYKGNTYNTPVAIWLLESYPNAAPRCFVVPTREMKIKDRHAHVGPQGLIYLPYLAEWHPARSQLIELVGILASTFSEDPPLYRAQDPSPSPYSLYQPPQPAPSSFQPYSPYPYQPPPVNNNNNPMNPFGNTFSPIPPPLSAEEKRKQEEAARKAKEQQEENARKQRAREEEAEKKQLEDKQKRTALKEVTMNLQAQLNTFNTQLVQDIDDMLDTQRRLVAGSQHLANAMGANAQQQKELENRLEALSKRNAELSQWLSQHGSAGPVEVDEAVAVKDAWSKQLLELVAEDHAIEDCIDCFDRALAEERMQLPEFLKQVRKLSRRQFEVRALCHKIFESQQAEFKR